MTRKIFFLFLMSLMLLMFVSSSFSKEWTEEKEKHFIFYYKNAPQEFIKEVKRASEDYYEEICRNLGFYRYKGWIGKGRAKIYIYDNIDDYRQAPQIASWSHGMAFAQHKIIRTFPSAHGFFDSILPHELGHIILREFVGFDADLPLWFEEGVAMYQEKAKRWGAHQQVKKSLEENSFIPLSALTNFKMDRVVDATTIDLFYAESASIVNYLIREGGIEKFNRLCDELKEGRPFEWTLKSVYVSFKTVDDLNKSWVKYLKSL
ncbi:MAG TPA: peptidase MA family metallohydrolase [Candidatus Omnitrophota bacterium]|nr:peptidase MA family metallohydrolase [Candidatus Omnitrophota bacterium]HPN88426.1 peptidase MA family metallohydrolase [Candidatus Omnitrophota bacterium]